MGPALPNGTTRRSAASWLFHVNVAELSTRDDHFGFQDLKDTDVLRPEVMVWGFTKPTKDSKHSRHVPRPVRVVRVAGNANKSIFGEWTRCPTMLALFREPAMGQLMMDRHWITQSKKQVPHFAIAKLTKRHY